MYNDLLLVKRSKILSVFSTPVFFFLWNDDQNELFGAVVIVHTRKLTSRIVMPKSEDKMKVSQIMYIATDELRPYVFRPSRTDCRGYE